MLGDKTEKVMRACYEVGEDIVRVSKRKRVQEDFDESVRRLTHIQAYARGFRERLIISPLAILNAENASNSLSFS